MKMIINEKGSLALEQVLFIGAIVLMSVGLYAFYDEIGDYFSNVSLSDAPTNIGSSTGNTGTGTGSGTGN